MFYAKINQISDWLVSNMLGDVTDVCCCHPNIGTATLNNDIEKLPKQCGLYYSENSVKSTVHSVTQQTERLNMKYKNDFIFLKNMIN